MQWSIALRMVFLLLPEGIHSTACLNDIMDNLMVRTLGLTVSSE